MRRFDRKKRVALLIDSATSWGRGILGGIASHPLTSEWSIAWKPRGAFEKFLLEDPESFDGLIARITHAGLAAQITSSSLPAVNVSWYRFGEESIARCTCDEVAAGRMAADHLLEKGYRNFAYCGAAEREGYLDRFGESFELALNQAGYRCDWFSREPRPECDVKEDLTSVPESRAALEDWLVELPKPVGLLTFHCVLARRIAEACEDLSINVPNDLAILGGDHDQLSVELSRPAITSIDMSPNKIGANAAQMLDDLMRDPAQPPATRLIPPAGIHERQSTNAVAISDHEISTAAEYIRNNATRGIRVSDVLRQLPISRRTLEKGFRRYFGRTPAEEIRRVRVYRAAELLRDSSLPVAQIATAAGFESNEVLIRSFRRQFGMAPTEYRGRHRV